MKRLLLGLAVVSATLVPSPARADGPFTRAFGFATKTGFRGVVVWEASQPVLALVHYGTSADVLDRTASAVPGVPDRAGVVFLAGLDRGATYFWQVEDLLSGARSAVGSFAATNAYNDWDGTRYTFDVVVQLDAPALPDAVTGDLGLGDLAEGVNVFAERVYDALDGYARIGTVLVTDTNVDYLANVPFATQAPLCVERGGNLGDFLIQTTVPADSHTWGGFAVDQLCTQISIGREAWLGARWNGTGLDIGYVMVHEFMHYAFNALDLYDTGTGGGGPSCVHLPTDTSLMHNSGGWKSTRWRNTELDRNPTLTPCPGLAAQDFSWPRLRTRYTNVPEVPDGPIDHIVDDAAKGNLDGGALDIWVLDREPLSSTLARYTPAL